MRKRLPGWGLGLIALLAACGGSAGEGACAAPRLVVEPASTQVGEEVTVTWVGPFECEGDPILAGGGVAVAIAAWPPDFTEPIERPDLVVPRWATFSFGEFDRSETAITPEDLPPGEYYLVATSVEGVESDRFVVG